MVRDFARTLAPGHDKLRPLTDQIRESYQKDVFQVSKDYIPQARVDAEELSYVSDESQKFNDALNDVWHIELAAFGCDPETRQAMMNEFMCLVRGMAFQSQWRREPEYFHKMLRDWLARAQSVLVPRFTAG